MTLKVGDRVGFARAFLRDTGQISGPVPFAKGTVAEMIPFGGPGRSLVTVLWDNLDGHRTVLDCNLVRLDRRHLERS